MLLITAELSAPSIKYHNSALCWIAKNTAYYVTRLILLKCLIKISVAEGGLNCLLARQNVALALASWLWHRRNRFVTIGSIFVDCCLDCALNVLAIFFLASISVGKKYQNVFSNLPTVSIFNDSWLIYVVSYQFFYNVAFVVVNEFHNDVGLCFTFWYWCCEGKITFYVILTPLQ